MSEYKRILTIQDISCVGQCSLTVALPILSSCGMETCVLPAAVLSTHTGGFEGFTFRDLTDDMSHIADHWVKEGIYFDAIYTGYLGSNRQVDIVKDIMKRTLVPGGLMIVDPAMADGGKLYTGFDEEHVEAMRELCACADIILPNITEACFLTGTEYREDDQNRAYAEELLVKLSKLGHAVVILKGILDREKAIGNAVYDPKTGKTDYYYTDLIDRKSHGTGDCFASVFTGALLRGTGAIKAAQIAADFVVRSIEYTLNDPDHWYGVKFEKTIPWLEKKLEETTGNNEKTPETELYIDEKLDITNVVSPVTFIKTKIVLEEMDDGQVLQVHLNAGEPVQYVPKSVMKAGHQILKLHDNSDGTYELYIRKAGDYHGK